MKTNKRLQRYIDFLMDLHSTKRFVVREMIRRHKISNSTKNSLIELNLIKKIPNIREYHFVGKKPTKQMALLLCNMVSSSYKKKDTFLKKISDYKECVSGDTLVYCDKVNDWKLNKDVKIINETKEQPFLLSFTWVETQKIKSFWKEKIIKSYAVSNALVYATDYKSACDKLKLKYKDVEIVEIKDLTIR